MIDKWKNAFDNKVFQAPLTNSSKAFDCICHGLLVAKANAYGLIIPAFRRKQHYLQHQKQIPQNLLLQSHGAQY